MCKNCPYKEDLKKIMDSLIVIMKRLIELDKQQVLMFAIHLKRDHETKRTQETIVEGYR